MAGLLIPEDWVKALSLLDDYGPDGVGAVIIKGFRSVPAGRMDIMLQWESVVEKLNAIAEAASTLH